MTIQEHPQISGNIIATGVSHDDFMAGYDGMRVEWVQGAVIEMPGVDTKHYWLSQFFTILLTFYLRWTGGGQVFQDPVLMRLPGISTRAPDIQVLLPEHLDQIRDNHNLGAADVVIEIISKGSLTTDISDKFREYERGGVREYWIFDFGMQTARFYRLNEKQKYVPLLPDETGVFRSSVLTKFALPIAVVWENMPPDPDAILALARSMTGKTS